MVVVNGAAYFDNQLFDNPQNFQPERFLDSDGNVAAPEKYTFFGLGMFLSVELLFAPFFALFCILYFSYRTK